MPRINEIKQEKIVVQSVGSFAHSLQQIAASRMAKLRRVVEASRRFIDESTVILRELELERTRRLQEELGITKHHFQPPKKTSSKTTAPIEAARSAIIVVSSDQGLSGSYNSEIVKKLDVIVPQHQNADYYVLGHKGQDYFKRVIKKTKLHYYPYNIPEEVSIMDLQPLIGMFYHYDQIYMVYSKYINTVTREVVLIELVVPPVETELALTEKVAGKYIFEPSLDGVINSISAHLRYALFRQQILDSKLSLYTAQMMAMKTASDNAEDLLKDLQLQYNKARRKEIDRKIQEVQAGRALWADE